LSAKLQKRFAEDKGIPPRIDMYNLTINIEEGIPPRIDMYNLTINIEVDNYDYLMELQEALNNGLAGIPSEKSYEDEFDEPVGSKNFDEAPEAWSHCKKRRIF